MQGPVRFGSRSSLDTADMKAARAKVNAALDALFDRLDAQEAALVAADRMREGYEAYEVVDYDTARAATRTA